MKIASISQTKNQLSALIDAVKQGETVLIMDRDLPVARLEPVQSSEFADDEGRILRLERAGALRRAKVKLKPTSIWGAPVKLPEGVSVLQALLEERETGR
jgi:antitoxin (DNA-binding transcriptional repressor) of toxin-antitoxin stability system